MEQSKKLRPLMLVGTGSDVGKSIINTGLCRIFWQDGYHPAPFKAQNMALNSYVTVDGLEIGRAQAVQAEAAMIECTTDMNPVLLKPSGERTSQIVLHGRPQGNKDAYEYFRTIGRGELRIEVQKAFDRLSSKYSPIVLEGAGSISELNLQDSDIVNMSMADYAQAIVILVADIDRGGVFASVYGSIMLQKDEYRKLIRGIIINKFRGDLRLFDKGKQMIEQLTGVPVIGVIPYFNDIFIEEEDSVALDKKFKEAKEKKINVAVIALRYISNYTDFDRLEQDNRVHLYYAMAPNDLEDADIIILPGSKSTMSDLIELRKKGMFTAILRAHREGKTIIGICGGYQLMGREIIDPYFVESTVERLPSLGLLPITTTMSTDKVTKRVNFKFTPTNSDSCVGYEVHMGQSVVCEGGKQDSPLTFMGDGRQDGFFDSQRCWGTYIHGILDNTDVIDYLLEPYLYKVKDSEKSNLDYNQFKQKEYDKLANHLKTYLDMDYIYKQLKS